jgi:TldD protein
MRHLCEEALRAAAEAGADYADVRVLEGRWRAVRTFARALHGVDRGHEQGLGVRVRIRGAWGFASAAEASLGAARVLGQRAAQLAEASGLLLTNATPLVPAPVLDDSWRTPYAQNPFDVSVSEQADLLLATEAALRGAPSIQAMAGRIACSRQTTWFMSSEGSWLVQERLVTGAGYRAFARTDDGAVVRSFPQFGEGLYQTGGWERVEALDLLGSAVQVADDASRLIYGVRCPEDVRTVVLTGSTVARLLHDTLGPCFEGDRLPWDGRDRHGTFVRADELGTRALASEVVTVASAPELPGAIGTCAWDDEGVAPTRVTLLDRGRWVGVLTDRESASRLGTGASTGSARASGFRRAPLVRHGNLELAGGSGSVTDLLAGLDDALLVDTPTRLEVDPSGRRFVLEAEVAWTIHRGRRWEIVRRPVLLGETVAFWQSCDAVAEGSDTVWSLLDPVRGVPAQPLALGVRAPAARFVGVTVRPAARA